MTSVLQLGSTAGVGNTIRDYMRLNGVSSDIMLFYPDTLGLGCDYDFSVKSKLLRMCLPAYSGYRLMKMMQHITKYDIIHVHAFGGITFYMDFPIWKSLGKKIVLHYHGTELRRFKKESPFADLADVKLVSTPDLLQYGNSLDWFPTPIPTHNYPFVGIPDKSDKDKDTFVIVNAASSLEHGLAKKGTQTIIDAVNNIKEQTDYKIEFKQLFGVPHHEAVEIYKQADFIIGQAKIGWYGKFEQECMLLGKPVITYLDPKYQALAKVFDIPIVNCGQENTKMLESAIFLLLEDAKLRKELSTAGREYITQIHNYNTVLGHLKTSYESLTSH